jgi:nucleoside-diphosphate-sugar epimerase
MNWEDISKAIFTYHSRRRDLMKILVTGATGRVGANLVKALLEKGHQVRAFIYPGDAARMTKLDTYDVEKIEGDLRNEDDISKSVEGMEVIYHIGAAMGGPFDSIQYFDINARGTLNVLEAARRQKNLHRVIYASTDALYPSEHKTSNYPEILTEESEIRPTMPYAMTKWFGEELCITYNRQYGLPTVSLRFALVVGPGELIDMPLPGDRMWLSKMMESLRRLKDRDPVFAEAFAKLEAAWPGEERLLLSRDARGIPAKIAVVDVRDLVQWLLAAMDREEAIGEIINVPGPEPMRWEVAVPMISERLGIPYVDVALPLETPFIYHCEIAYEKAHRLLGYQPIHGMKSMLDLALAMREGKDMGLIPTGIPYGEAE